MRWALTSAQASPGIPHSSLTVEWRKSIVSSFSGADSLDWSLNTLLRVKWAQQLHFLCRKRRPHLSPSCSHHQCPDQPSPSGLWAARHDRGNLCRVWWGLQRRSLWLLPSRMLCTDAVSTEPITASKPQPTFTMYQPSPLLPTSSIRSRFCNSLMYGNFMPQMVNVYWISIYSFPNILYSFPYK